MLFQRDMGGSMGRLSSSFLLHVYVAGHFSLSLNFHHFSFFFKSNCFHSGLICLPRAHPKQPLHFIYTPSALTLGTDLCAS